MFRILAEVPEAPVKHDRRASDRRAPGDTGEFRTRASDRGPARAGTAAGRAAGSGQRISDLEMSRPGSANDRVDIPAKSASETS